MNKSEKGNLTCTVRRVFPFPRRWCDSRLHCSHGILNNMLYMYILTFLHAVTFVVPEKRAVKPLTHLIIIWHYVCIS
jgi:hypothetical protein